MAKLTKSEFARYDPNALTGCADRLRNIVDGLRHGADDSGSAQKNAANNFQGTAADAINEQATKDVGALHQAHDAVEGLRAAYANGAQALWPSVNALREAQRSATQQGFTIAENWQLGGDQSSGMGRTILQHNLQEQIDSAVTALDQADEQVSGDISKAHLALANTPFPQITVDQVPAPEQPPKKPDEPQPDQPKPDDRPQDQGQLGAAHDVGSEEKPGVTDVNDPGVQWRKGFDPEVWKKSWQNPQLADNPPGYTGGSGPARDQAWKDYLATLKPGTRGFLPNPGAVSDKGLKNLGYAGNQLGTSYAWAGGDTKGPGQGVVVKGDESETFQDNNRVGFDCSGLAEYAAGQVTGQSIGGYTGSQLESPRMHSVAPAETPQPGDFVYYGTGEGHHVGIYVAPGIILNAPGSGLPVQLDQRTTTADGSNTRIRRLN